MSDPIFVQIDDLSADSLEMLAETLLATVEELRRRERWAFILRDRCLIVPDDGSEERN